MIFFSNKNYKVVSSEDNVGYDIINNVTGVLERKEGMLPVAISLALQMDGALEEFASEQSKKDQRIVTPANEILLPH